MDVNELITFMRLKEKVVDYTVYTDGSWSSVIRHDKWTVAITGKTINEMTSGMLYSQEPSKSQVVVTSNPTFEDIKTILGVQ